jgi:hypothetical protein
MGSIYSQKMQADFKSLWETGHAAWCNNLEAARMLLDAGTDPLHEEHNGLHPYSSLALSAELGFGEMARLLWSAVPPDIRSRCDQDECCLAVVALYGYHWLVGDMLNWPADGLSIEMNNEALFNAALRWHIHVVAVLLDRVDTYTPGVLRRGLTFAVRSKSMLAQAERFDVVYDAVGFINQELLVTRLIEAGALDPNWSWTESPLIYHTTDAINLVGSLRAVLSKG